MAQTMLDLFQKTREQRLQEARDTARKLLKNQPNITIEDVLRECPRPNYLHRNTTGKVFNDDFYPVGFTKSKRTISKGRWIRQWALKGEFYGISDISAN